MTLELLIFAGDGTFRVMLKPPTHGNGLQECNHNESEPIPGPPEAL